MENRAHAIAAGLFVLGLLLSAALVGHWLAGSPQVRKTYRVVSTMPVSGLNVQGQVRFRGIGVGRVTAIDLDLKDTRRILVDIEVEARIPLTKGTYAQLGMEGITGIAYVHLLDDGDKPEPIDKGVEGTPEIALKPSVLDEVMDSAGTIAKDAKTVLASMQRLLADDNQKNVSATLASIQSATASLDAAAKRLPGAIERADQMLSEANRRALSESLASLNASAKELPEIAREARQALAEARKAADSVGRLSEELRGATTDVRRDTLPRAQALAESVERGAERVGRLAYELERRPESVIWGRGGTRPGPGEAGFE